MPFISATRLRVRSLRYLIGFFRANEASAKQLILTPGFLGGKELIDKNLTFWTLTIWQSIDSMKAFRNSEPHKKAMQKLPFWCDEASYLHWEQEEVQLPDWGTVHKKMITAGKSTKVRKPSANQQALSYPPVKWTRLQREFKAANSG